CEPSGTHQTWKQHNTIQHTNYNKHHHNNNNNSTLTAKHVTKTGRLFGNITQPRVVADADDTGRGRLHTSLRPTSPPQVRQTRIEPECQQSILWEARNNGGRVKSRGSGQTMRGGDVCV
ncbi:hypothetical protein Ahia01_001212500, partial [Argonauta hians]